jgi:hypothetical protein
MMEKSSPRSIVPVCPLTHSLLGKLQVILGYCDLLVERHSQDSESSNHLQLIRQAVQSMGGNSTTTNVSSSSNNELQQNVKGRLLPRFVSTERIGSITARDWPRRFGFLALCGLSAVAEYRFS